MMEKLSRIVSLSLITALASCSGFSNSYVPAMSSNASFAAGNGSGAAAPIAAANLPTPIQHVIIIVQENRTPDNLFQGLPGADIQSYGVDSKGQKITLSPLTLATQWDLNHMHTGFINDYNNGKMNGWDRGVPKANRMRPFSYVYPREAKPYLEMAKQYAFADRMFQSNRGPSFPAHLYLVSGATSGQAQLPYIDIGNPHQVAAKKINQLAQPDTYGATKLGGCDSPSNTVVPTIDPSTGAAGPEPFPCFDRKVLPDLLDSKGASWRWYQQDLGPALWHAMDAYKHIRYGPDYANVITPPTAVLNDITSGTLANVSWVIPADPWSDHAGPNSTAQGPSWVAEIVDQIGNSQYWNNTTIIVTWDDWGGWYDHVKPPTMNHAELGFRVPLIVISPYAKKGYVSHKQHEFASILNYAEETFGIAKGSLGSSDTRADDLMDMVDYNQTPRAFKNIPSPPFNGVVLGKNLSLEDP